MTDKFPEIIGIPMQTPIRVKIGNDMEEKQIHQQRYADADLFYKKYYQMHSLIPSDKKTNGD